ncbi:hypothetical protein CYMTET_16441 [Cymbomonas tetramitiformis]|uniref:Fe2OG dioxygenase domain-containing protein n=1 Tax=Cymbomonas tetramitiformis TaxID=36881 RepID=A0AAE0GCH9_9CHLO|nr:hypothetical protein CYMTET_16441 [Cymbomonas tetramitiformis]|eukprot:gene28401-35200_t
MAQPSTPSKNATPGIIEVPVIDISKDTSTVVPHIRNALSTWGAFVCTGHGVDSKLCEDVFRTGYQFFNLPQDVKDKYNLKLGGARWRGYMPIGGERSLQGRIEDFKEGLYLGEDHSPNNPHCLAKDPTWGANLLPDDELPQMRDLMLRYTEEVKRLGDRMMDLISLSLGLSEKYIQEHVTERDAIALVRMFHYPPQDLPTPNISEKKRKFGETCREPDDVARADKWGIGAHSDYGLWTMIRTDAEGLEFKHPEHGWRPVPLVEDSFVMNVGDVLDRLTEGRYKSRHHRAINPSSTRSRLSIPFFYDPGWNSRMTTLPMGDTGGFDFKYDSEIESRQERWAHTKIQCAFDGKVQYSEFLAKKVAKVFPDLVPKNLLRNLDSTSEPSTRHHITVPVPSKLQTSALVDSIQEHRQRVLKHPLYLDLQRAWRAENLVALRTFMEHHVWAVYDYFQLLKRLQRELTCVEVPWVPTKDAQMRRFISEIVLEEECDVFEDGKTHGSHLELYIRAMEEVGADTAPISKFLTLMQPALGACGGEKRKKRFQVDFKKEAVACGAPEAAARHIQDTFDLAMNKSVAEVAAVFTFGREDVIPPMFCQLLDDKDSSRASIFKYYLQRHIELDGQDHAPLAVTLVERLCGTNVHDQQTAHNWAAAEQAVKAAFTLRAMLWDSVVCSLKTSL